MLKVARILALMVSSTILASCSVYKSSDRDEFDSKGKDRAGITALAYADLCSIIPTPKQLLVGVDELVVTPSISEGTSRCTYKARGRGNNLDLLVCELNENASDFSVGVELESENEEPTFSAKSQTEIGFLKCAVTFEGLANDRNEAAYEKMSLAFAHFHLGLTLRLTNTPAE
ncbi:MAG: hypothetical protein V4692_10725 [Bdellovibrionota bacterium]